MWARALAQSDALQLWLCLQSQAIWFLTHALIFLMAYLSNLIDCICYLEKHDSPPGFRPNGNSGILKTLTPGKTGMKAEDLFGMEENSLTYESWWAKDRWRNKELLG
jgi:hypothetical protein